MSAALKLGPPSLHQVASWVEQRHGSRPGVMNKDPAMLIDSNTVGKAPGPIGGKPEEFFLELVHVRAAAEDRRPLAEQDQGCCGASSDDAGKLAACLFSQHSIRFYLYQSTLSIKDSQIITRGL